MGVQTIKDLPKILNKIGRPLPIRTNKKEEFYNIPCAFDIETTSFYKFNKLNSMDEKQAIMYCWAFCIMGNVIIGRTWKEFQECLDILVEHFILEESRRLIIYVHNLSFEFQFFRKLFIWEKVFSLDKRKPIQAITIDGIEFRCSYLLSGYSLAKLGEQLIKYPIKKLVGDLDYSLKRHSKTTLTEKEIGYVTNDVLVVNNYIQEKLEQYGNITKLPLTKTGFVRTYCRENCFYDKPRTKDSTKYHKYHNLMKSLWLDVDTYKQLKRAFAGGFTHANAYYVGDTLHNVHSFDFTSSYPYVMVSEKFPMSAPQSITIKSKEDLKFNLLNYCCLFDVEFVGLESRVDYENYLSESHCYNKKGVVANNGRIVKADSLITTITEQDFFIIDTMYKWEDIKIYNFKRFMKGYLPTDFIKSILKLYNDKTTLKGVTGKEVEYLVSKENVNSCYGMCVTDICRDDIIYQEEWYSEKPDLDEAISKYNKSKRRFLYYPWGIWVTAYARRNLFTGINEFKEDYIYSDTDSIKVFNIENHEKYIQNYNKLVSIKLKKACDYHKIDVELTRPKTINGKVKELGVWDYECCYDRFKTIGAKRYMTDTKGEISITVSGVNKKKAVPYLLKKYGKENIFKAFDNELHIPATYIENGEELNATGKMTHTYIDEYISGELIDYKGVKCRYEEHSGVHLENTDYSLSLSQTYVEYLLNIRSSTC